jgi:hypothetical protein
MPDLLFRFPMCDMHLVIFGPIVTVLVRYWPCNSWPEKAQDAIVHTSHASYAIHHRIIASHTTYTTHALRRCSEAVAACQPGVSARRALAIDLQVPARMALQLQCKVFVG